MTLSIIIMAAGKGTRMKSRLPKVLQPLAGRPLLAHVLDKATALGADRVITIYGHGGSAVKAAFADQSIDWVEQVEQLGTGHAVQAVLPVLPQTGFSLILSGDVPLIQTQTLTALQDAAKSGIAMVTMRLDNPTGLGRIVRDAAGNIQKIVEHKDASPDELNIQEINTGIYCVRNDLLHRWLPQLSNNNAQGEYYLTDIVEMAVNDGLCIGSAAPSLDFEIEGVNDRAQLASLECRFQHYQAEQLMLRGVMLLDPCRFDLRGTLSTGLDVCIDVNVIIEGDCYFADGVKIGAGCVIKNAVLGENVVIAPYSVLENVRIGDGASIGPFARLRPGTVLDKDVHIGNFVEVKNSHLGAGTKAGHLSYIGDAEIGSETNIGAGTITCNYDGANKHKTIIGNQVFIGSNSALVAPIQIDNGATIGAGSVITRAVAADELAVARGLQRNIAHYVRPTKIKK